MVSLDAFLSRGCEKARFGALARSIFENSPWNVLFSCARAFPEPFPTCFTCSGEIDRAVLVLQACDGALFLVSLDTILS